MKLDKHVFVLAARAGALAAIFAHGCRAVAWQCLVVFCFYWSIVCPLLAQNVTLKVGEPLKHFDYLRPGVHRYVRYTVEGQKRTILDIWTRTVSMEENQGRKLLRITQRWEGAGANPYLVEQDSWFEPSTFRPLTHVREVHKDNETHFGGYRFLPGKIAGMPELANNEKRDFEIASPEPAFNFEYDMELLQVLPLGRGYSASINFYDPGRDPPKRYTFTVSGSGRIRAADGRYIDCWVVTSDYNQSGYVARFWFAKRGQTLMHEETAAPDGSRVVKSLLPAEASDPDLGTSVQVGRSGALVRPSPGPAAKVRG